MAEAGEQVRPQNAPISKENKRQVILEKFGYYKLFPQKEAREDEKLRLKTYGDSDVFKIISGEIPKDNPLGKRRKVGVLYLSGAQTAAISAGIAMAMDDLGKLENIDGVFVVSAGFPVYACVELGKGDKGFEIISDENTKEDYFIKLPKNPFKIMAKFLSLVKNGPKEHLIDTFTVEKDMKKRGIDLNELEYSPRELVTVLMDEEGEPVYKDIRQYIKETKNASELMNAAICIPAVSPQPSVLLNDGKRYMDGAYADPVPILEMLRRGYDTILVVAPKPVEEGGIVASSAQFIHAEVLAHNYGYKDGVKKSIRDSEKKAGEQAKLIGSLIMKQNPNQKIAVIAPENGVLTNVMERRRDVLVMACQNAREFARNLFTHGEDFAYQQQNLAKAA